MSFAELDNHAAIAWDFDGTLFNHPKSAEMAKYILANPDKRHVIVTFRSGPWAKDVWRDLSFGEIKIGPAHFDALIHMSEEEFQENGAMRTASGFIESTAFYKEWKGSMCAKHGLTVLIDDNHYDTFPGCAKYDIVYIDPDNL